MTRRADDADWLRRRWVERFPRSGLRSLGDSLVARYADPARVYHDVRHLRRLLETVDVLADECADPVVVELAAWFHDAVYDAGATPDREGSGDPRAGDGGRRTGNERPGNEPAGNERPGNEPAGNESAGIQRAGNEEASAALARALLAPYLHPMALAEVARLVLLTRDHAVVDGDGNAAVLCDADLVVLADGADAYDAYVRRVRTEFAAVDDDDFRTGRAALLRALLDLPALFHTRLGAADWETPARANLRRELAALRPLG